MEIFTLVIFGFASIRTLTGFIRVKDGFDFVGQLFVAITTWWCYIWLLMTFLSVNSVG